MFRLHNVRRCFWFHRFHGVYWVHRVHNFFWFHRFFLVLRCHRFHSVFWFHRFCYHELVNVNSLVPG